MGVALALSAAQWVPTVATAWQTPRLAPPEAVRTQWSVHPARTLEIALPLRMPQLPLPDSIRGSLFDSGEVLLRSLYGGLGAALLVLCALAARQRRAWCLFAVFVSATLVALGRHAPVYGVVVGVLPVLRAFRYPEKAMVVAALAFALLAGVGLDACRRGAFGRRRILAFALPGGLLVLAAGVAALVALGVLPAGPVGGGGGPALSAVLAPAGPRLAVAAVFGCLALAVQVRFAKGGAGGRSAVALGLLAVLDLMAAHADLNPTAPGEMFRLRPLALDALRVDDHSRLYVFDYALPGRSERYLGHAGGFSLAAGPPLAWRGMAAARTYPHPFTLASFGLEGSFVADTILLYPPHLDTLTRALFESEETAAELRLLRAGAVGRVVALHGRGFEDLVPLATRPSLFREPMRLFQVPDPVPRSYPVGTVPGRKRRGGAAFSAGPGAGPAGRGGRLRGGAERGPGVVRGLEHDRSPEAGPGEAARRGERARDRRPGRHLRPGVDGHRERPAGRAAAGERVLPGRGRPGRPPRGRVALPAGRGGGRRAGVVHVGAGGSRDLPAPVAALIRASARGRPLRGPAAAPLPRAVRPPREAQASVRSVLAKSLPVHSNGSPASFATA